MNNHKILYFLALLIFLVFGSCSKEDELIIFLQEEEILSAENQYFIDIAFGNELGNNFNALRKWTTDIKIYLADSSYGELNEELHSIISEINDLSETITLEIVNDSLASNYIIYFGDANSYVQKYEPNAMELAQSNWGVFWVYWNGNHEITRGSMYVDVFRTQEEDCRKHLLREELTQSLGLMNDSFQYPQSMFYQDWTCGTSFATVDEILIQYILSTELKAGMSKSQVIEILKTL